MNQNYFFVIILIFIATLLQQSSTQPVEVEEEECSHNNTKNNYYFGEKESNDSLLYHDDIAYISSRSSGVSLKLHYPASSRTSAGIISYIEVLDEDSKGNGGCAVIEKGGLGSDVLTLQLKSKKFYGFHFIVNIYGEKY